MYRQAINISTHSTGETNVYIIASVNIGTTTKAQADDGDFRFTDAQGNLLPYFISANTGTTAPEFHIQISNFPSGALTIFAYYGNPSVSNGFSSADFSTLASNYSIGSYSSEETGGAPVAWWKFDEGVGTTAFDSSTNRNNGVNSNAVWQSENQCMLGKCLFFNGTSSLITVSNSPSIQIIGNQTITMWIKPNTLIGRRNPIAKAYGGEGTITFEPGNNFNYYWGINGINGGTYVGVNSSTGVILNQWSQIVLVRNISANTVTWYINGRQTSQTSSAYAAAVAGTLPLYIGGGYAGNFSGYIDDVKIFNYARSATQIKKDYVTGISGQSNSEGSNSSFGSDSSKSLSDGLVGYWKFDEGVGTTTADSSGNSFTTTLSGTLPTWAGGKYGIGLSFGGSNTYASVSTSSTFDFLTSNYSISTWIKSTSSASNRTIVWKGNPFCDSCQGGYTLYLSGGKPYFVINLNNTTGNLYSASSTIMVNDGQWHNLIAQRNDNKLQLYVDGNLSISSTLPAGAAFSDITGSTLQFSQGSFSFEGSLDEVRIYNRALNSDEIKQLYNYAPGPIGYWKFEEGSGSTAFDSSGNSNNNIFGTGTSAPTWNIGKIGKGLLFNSNQYSTSTLSKTFISYSMTISGWVNTNQSGIQRIFTTSAANTQFGVNGNSQLFVHTQTSTGTDTNTPIPALPTSCRLGWHYLAVTWDNTLSSNNVKVYCDGNNIANGTLVNALNGYFNLTSFSLGYNSSSQSLTGSLDDIKIYNYARTNEQIIQDMQGNNSSSKLAGPIIWYKYDEGFGTTPKNSGIGGSIYNANFGVSTSAPSWFNEGKVGKALNFDGTDDYTYFTTTGLYPDFTYTTWIKPSNCSGDRRIYNGGSNTWNLFYITGTTLRLALYQPSITTTTYWNGPTITCSQWNHVSVTYNTGGNVIFYLNGVRKTVLSADTNTVNGGINQVGGSSEYTSDFAGQIDEAKIYNYVLSDDEIKQDYNAGATTKVGQSTQTIGTTTTSLDYCIPGDASACSAPIAEWKFEEGIGTTAYDTSGNGNNNIFAAGTSSPDWSVGKFGKGISFNGTSDYAYRTMSPNFGGDVTFDFWYKPHGNGYIFDRNWGHITYRQTSSQQATFYCHSGATMTTNSATYDNWHHVTGICNTTAQTASLYIDNLPVISVGFTSPNLNANPITLGAVYLGQGGGFFNGTIDQFKIYNYARTPAQVAYDYNKGGPIGWWKFDECQGNISNDSSGIGNTGSITIGSGGTQNSLGTCTVGTSAAWTSGATGKINGSLNFDGTDDYISTVLLHPDDLTWSAWVKTATNGTIAGTNYGNASTFWHGGLTIVAGKPNMEIGYISLAYRNQAGTTTITDNNWHHLAFTSSTSGSNLYVDGKLDATSAYYVGQVAGTSEQVTCIGATCRTTAATGFYFNGKLDDVRLYNYALTSEQVKNIYSGGSVNFR
jgi:hypothetical protein